MSNRQNHSSMWIMIVAAIILEAISCVQYFTSRAAIRHQAQERAQTELRKAELEIEKHTVEMEAAAHTLAMLAEKYVDQPDSIFSATQSVVRAIDNTGSVAVAYIPNYFPSRGRYFEVCSSRITADSIYTRLIGSAKHDYTKLAWFKNGLVHDSCYWSEPYLDNSGSRTMVVSCSCPVCNAKKEIVAVVCVDLSLEYLQRVSEYLQIYPNSYYSIRSGNGLDIVPTPDTIPGLKYNIFSEQIDATGWRLEIIIPDEVLFADLNRTGLLVGILMILGLIVLALMLVHASRTNSRLMRTTERNQRIEDELHIASAIQTAMLPKVFPPHADRADLNLYGLLAPAKEVGGDLYDFYVRQDKLFFCVGDVSGKGVPAALVMAMTRSLFRTLTAHDDDPAIVLRKMNRALCDQNSQNMFLTFFLGVLDCRTGELRYCNAGHNAPAYCIDSAWYLAPVNPNLPLGIEPDYDFQAQSAQLHYGDQLFLYTDGLTEAEDHSHCQLGVDRMLTLLNDSIRSEELHSPRALVISMRDAVNRFVHGAEQSDDLTMLAVRYQHPALYLTNDIQQIPLLAQWLETLSLPDKLLMSLNLALEETLANIMLYAYPETQGQIRVEYAPVADQHVFVITDEGLPFDPTAQPEVDTSLSAEERPIGGLGIHLVRRIMNHVHYARVNNKNVLTLIK